jgi:hypothetical protein
MTTRWVSPLTEARPPARPRTLDWQRVVAYVAVPVAFWGAIALLVLYLLGAF